MGENVRPLHEERGDRLVDLSATACDTDGEPGQGMLMPLTDTERLDEDPGGGPATAARSCVSGANSRSSTHLST
ncbi:hypothetical protein [Streptomyces sp. NPDC029526]|uniref:hypothetical protein n=1 Tax=Streptomyces sp. NPDC029526 TaxID=3155728 RepID=UPI0033F64945